MKQVLSTYIYRSRHLVPRGIELSRGYERRNPCYYCIDNGEQLVYAWYGVAGDFNPQPLKLKALLPLIC